MRENVTIMFFFSWFINKSHYLYYRFEILKMSSPQRRLVLRIIIIDNLYYDIST